MDAVEVNDDVADLAGDDDDDDHKKIFWYCVQEMSRGKEGQKKIQWEYST